MRSMEDEGDLEDRSVAEVEEGDRRGCRLCRPPKQIRLSAAKEVDAKVPPPLMPFLFPLASVALAEETEGKIAADQE